MGFWPSLSVSVLPAPPRVSPGVPAGRVTALCRKMPEPPRSHDEPLAGAAPVVDMKFVPAGMTVCAPAPSGRHDNAAVAVSAAPTRLPKILQGRLSSTA